MTWIGETWSAAAGMAEVLPGWVLLGVLMAAGGVGAVLTLVAADRGSGSGAGAKASTFLWRYYIGVCVCVACVWALALAAGLPLWGFLFLSALLAVHFALAGAARGVRSGMLVAAVRAVLSGTGSGLEGFLFGIVSLAVILPFAAGTVAASLSGVLTWEVLFFLIFVPTVVQALALFIDELETEAGA